MPHGGVMAGVGPPDGPMPHSTIQLILHHATNLANIRATVLPSIAAQQARPRQTAKSQVRREIADGPGIPAPTECAIRQPPSPLEFRAHTMEANRDSS
jgi:hypothetical protein